MGVRPNGASSFPDRVVCSGARRRERRVGGGVTVGASCRRLVSREYDGPFDRTGSPQLAVRLSEGRPGCPTGGGWRQGIREGRLVDPGVTNRLQGDGGSWWLRRGHFADRGVSRLLVRRLMPRWSCYSSVVPDWAFLPGGAIRCSRGGRRGVLFGHPSFVTASYTVTSTDFSVAFLGARSVPRVSLVRVTVRNETRQRAVT